MRKLGLLLILFLVMGAFAFAADMTVEERVAALESNSAIVPAVSASATLTFGYDLQNSVAGFSNTASASVKITWYDDATLSKGGDGWYGSIEIDHITWMLSTDLLSSTNDNASFTNKDDNDPGAVTAKITNGSVYAKIYTAPGKDINDSSAVDTAAFNGGDATIGVASVLKPAMQTANTVQGVTVGYGSGMITDISLGLVSDGDYLRAADTVAGTNTANDFGIRLDADIVPMDLLEVKASLVYGTFQAAQPAVGFGLQPIITVSSIMSGLTVTLGFDGQSDTAFTWDASAGVALNLAAANADGDQDNVAVKVLYSKDETIDASVAVKSYASGGLMDGVGFGITATLADLTGTTLGYAVDVTAEYNQGGLNPYAELYIDDASTTGVKVGVALTSDLTSIDNTTFTLEYKSADVANDTGVVTFATKIEY